MGMPAFTNSQDVIQFMIEFFDDYLKKLKSAGSPQEQIRIFQELDMLQFGAEEQILNGQKIKDNPDYQKAKEIVFDFLDWVHKTRNIDIVDVSHKDKFFNELQGGRTLLIAQLIQNIKEMPIELQEYFLMNIFRTTYELNFKNMELILHEVFIKKEKIKDYYDLSDFKNEFADYLRFNEILDYFKNDIRNPIAHENWFVKNGRLWTKNKAEEKKRDFMEISKEIYTIFFFRVAVVTYLMSHYKDFAKSIKIKPEEIKVKIENLEKKINELKQQYSS